MSEFLPLPCFCGAYRRVERILTRHYEHCIRPSGLSVGQFSLLAIVMRSGSLSQQQLGTILAMDKATLSRNIQPLLKQGFLQVETPADRRVKQLCLTPSGREKIREIMPLWRNAQQSLKQKLGDDFSPLLEMLNKLPERLNG